ncbi:MAG: hypothetical protein M1831_004481 [Alyxoria varia]|nr:MAG: hypothetical protein M1831_004481 [Alyxoria varia]
MRAFRILISLFSTVTLFVGLLFVSLSSESDHFAESSQSEHPSNSWKALFSFRSPSALFTPSATISLTDDNSTYFAARPAAFGPLVPTKGLSGQIWIGSGFGDDNLDRSGLTSTVEGELGCNDIPGWHERDWSISRKGSGSDINSGTSFGSRSTPLSGPLDGSKDSAKQSLDQETSISEDLPSENDGTDDGLHYPLQKTPIKRSRKDDRRSNPLSEHADIQSIQESAEINGKVVLLSRGGCGFSEKVKWAQRRGASAVIVGDSLRGGPLVRMYARGDTSNITVPSLFTSHTTAHLLSSLVPPFHNVGENRPISELPPASGRNKNSDKQGLGDPSPAARPTDEDGAPQSQRATGRSTKGASVSSDHITQPHGQEVGFGRRGNWFSARSLLSSLSFRRGKASGDDGDHDKSYTYLDAKGLLKGEATPNGEGSSTHKRYANGFVIGVHDWRDPDMIRPLSSTTSTPASTAPRLASSATSEPARLHNAGVKMPGSGEYATISKGSEYNRTPLANSRPTQGPAKSVEGPDRSNLKGTNPNWTNNARPKAGNSAMSLDETSHAHLQKSTKAPHDGLWVTLTLTSMNTSPFFNTLFVLVISPLITLAVVYIMLLIRSRIRRRRWRAPKAVVERLPVRIYQALSQRSSPRGSDSGSQSPATQATPLLSRARSNRSGSSSGSRPAEDDPNVDSAPPNYGSLDSNATEQEKAGGALSEWRKRYGKKQIECAVCLEEYVDGVSKVMSLPCGHEFHADCITPWLTTRRRTCPICKGDVVRSLGQSSSSQDVVDETPVQSGNDVQTQAAHTRNESPSSALPIPPHRRDLHDDIERGEGSQSSAPSDPESLSWIMRRARRNLESWRRTAGRSSEQRDEPSEGDR